MQVLYLCTFYTCLVSLTSQLELVNELSRAELDFWLVKITSRASSLS
jgi:hypothetical protein